MALADTISTGVDGFINLIHASGKIEINEAAAKLEVSRSVLEEWAQVLEEQGLIRIEYQLTKFYLVWLGGSIDAPAAAEAKKDQARDEKEAAIMLAQAQLQDVANIGSSLETLKRRFAEVHGAFETKFGGVRDMIEKLYELKRQREEILFQLNELGNAYDARSKSIGADIARIQAESEAARVSEEALEAKIAVLAQELAHVRSDQFPTQVVEQRLAELSRKVEPLQKEYGELHGRSERLTVSLKKLKESNAALEKDITRRKSELDRVKKSSDAQMDHVSSELEAYLREATMLVSEFESRIGMFDETEARLKRLTAEQDAVNADIARIIKELKDINTNKARIPIADVFARINAAKNKVDALGQVKERQLREQADVEALLKKAL